MRIRWVASSEDSFFPSPPPLQILEKKRSQNPEDFVSKCFRYKNLKLSFGLKFSEEKFGQEFCNLFYDRPVCIYLTFQKNSRQLVELVVKPQVLIFSQFELEILSLKVPKAPFPPFGKSLETNLKKVTLCFSWNRVISDGSRKFEKQTFFFDGGEVKRRIESNKAEIVFECFRSGENRVGTFIDSKPKFFKNFVIGEDCKILFQLEGKTLETLVFTKPQYITIESRNGGKAKGLFLTYYMQSWTFECIEGAGFFGLFYFFFKPTPT